jgi:hypothetical protein
MVLYPASKYFALFLLIQNARLTYTIFTKRTDNIKIIRPASIFIVYSLFEPEAFHTGNYTEILRADM